MRRTNGRMPVIEMDTVKMSENSLFNPLSYGDAEKSIP
jgi:hypothetical protein